MAITLAIAPIFLLIVLGYALRRGGIPSEEFWALNDRLVYFILMPALFFVRISTADLVGAGLGPFTATLYLGFFAGLGFGLVAAWYLAKGPAVGTSVMQGASRFNTFVALAVAEALYGAAGLEWAVLGATVLVPVANITAVIGFVVLMPQTKPGSAIWDAVRQLGTNPLILAILAGVAINLAGIALIPVLHETLEVLGQAALPIMLLSVGASLKLRGLSADLAPLLFSVAGKLALFPAVTILAALALGLSPLSAQVALIYAAIPAGVVAYTLARQLGGDASLMAAMITIQTLLSVLTLPLWLSLGEWVFGL